MKRLKVIYTQKYITTKCNRQLEIIIVIKLVKEYIK